MPPRVFSRYTFVDAVLDSQDRLFLTDREPFRYRALPDNRRHPVGSGDTLFNIAGRRLRGLPRPAGLWWVIADFQPEPIFDPTVELVNGTVMIVPSVRTVRELVFSEDRRLESTV